MNPAALKANLAELPPGVDAARQLRRVRRAQPRARSATTANPLDDGSLAAYRVVQVPMTTITLEARKELGVKPRDAERSKNFFALGLDLVDVHAPGRADARVDRPAVRARASWCTTPTSPRSRPGYNFGETAELFDHPYEIQPAQLAPGHYRNITGNLALVVRAASPAAQQAKLPILYASYPITPASDILHELSKHKNFGVRTLQAEDEIAAIGVAIGAAFAGQLGVTATSGPGVDLKSEALGLAISLELPLVLDRRAARRPVDRPAHEDRAVRPAARDVRPSRRGAAADRRGAVAEPLLRRRVRGRAHRAEVPHAGDPPHRRLPRQRRRAVAAARRRRAARHLGAVRRPSRTTATDDFWPYLPRPRDARPAVGDPGHARA